MQWFHGTGAKDFIKYLDAILNELLCDDFEAPWQLGYVGEGDLKVLSDVWVLVRRQPRDNGLND